MTQCLAVAPGERVVVVAHPDSEAAAPALAIFDAALAARADPVLVVTRPRQGAELADPALIAALESDPEVIAIFTRGLLGGDPKRLARPIHGKYTHYLQYLMSEAPTRGFWCPGVTRDAFTRGVVVELPAIRARAEALRAALAETVELQVTGRDGTRLVVPVDPAGITVETGDYREPGAGGQLPAGEVLLPVAAAGAEGRLTTTGVLGLPDSAVRLKEVVTLEFQAGTVTGVKGGAEARRLETALADASRLAERAVRAGWLTRDQSLSFAKNARRLREVGFGVNPALKPRGDPYGDGRAVGVTQLRLGAGRHEYPPGAPVAVDLLAPGLDVTAVREDAREVPVIRSGRLVTPLARPA